MKHEHMHFSIIQKDGKEEVEEVAIEVVDLLGDFLNSLFNNRHDGWPPMRMITHQIDLILGASFPNKVVHRMKPIESE